jgi:hypothetical protein
MQPTKTDQHGPLDLRCSFCAKSQRDVAKLVAGPNVQICDECVDICADILAEDRKEAPPLGSSATSPVWGTNCVVTASSQVATSCSLCRMPTPVEHMLSIPARGALCRGCIGAIEGAVALAREHAT